MGTVEKITLIFTISSFILVFLLGSQGLILSPFFTIDVSQSDNTTVTVKNIGMSQAKNAVINILGEKPFTMTNNVCLEQSNIDHDENRLTIFMDRFSTGIDCTLTFEGNIQYQLQHIAVSSDDSRGLEWNPLDDMMNRFYLLMVGLYGTIAAIVATIITSIIGVYVRRQKKDTIKKYQTQEVDVTQKIKTAEDEMNLLQKTLSSSTNPHVISALSQKITSLDEHIRNLYNESDKVKSSISLEGKFEEKIGAFYVTWTEVEQQLNRIALKSDIDPIRIRPYALIRQLFEKELISKTIMNDFNDVRKFRNSIVHGFLTPTNSELDSEITKVKKLLGELQKILSDDTK